MKSIVFLEFYSKSYTAKSSKSKYMRRVFLMESITAEPIPLPAKSLSSRDKKISSRDINLSDQVTKTVFLGQHLYLYWIGKLSRLDSLGQWGR